MEKPSDKIAQFNSSASSYDDEFTFSTIGKLQRERVYYWLNIIGFFSSSKKVFEINCGTGYDAEQFYQHGHQVLATDVSESMIAYAKGKRSKRIEFKIQSFQEVAISSEVSNYNVLFSNFGGLNCINKGELINFFNKIASNQNQGQQLICVLMSKECWIESVYFFFKGEFSKMNRRNTNNGIGVTVKEEKVTTYYYLPEEVETILKPNYKIKLVKPIAVFLPPSYMEPFFKRNKIALQLLNKLEQIFGRFTYLANKADHYIIVAEKR